MQSAGARKRRRTETGLAYDMSLRKSNSQTETPGNLVDPSQSTDAAENILNLAGEILSVPLVKATQLQGNN